MVNCYIAIQVLQFGNARIRRRFQYKHEINGLSKMITWLIRKSNVEATGYVTGDLENANVLLPLRDLPVRKVSQHAYDRR